MPPPTDGAPLIRRSGPARADRALASVMRRGLLELPGRRLDDEIRFDFACLTAQALVERAQGRGRLPDLLGLERGALNALADRYFPNALLPDLDRDRAAPPADQTAVATLLRWRGGAEREEGVWLADMLARRAMEPRHLWEDCGLPARPALTAMITRLLPRMAALNTANMRWKKFFYRQICSDQAFSLCVAPSCGECPERDDCFAPEDGLAQA